MLTKDVEIPEEDFIKRGRMKKSPFKMTEEELEAWNREMSAGIREYLFSIGQPLVYAKDGQYVAEHADGRIELL